MRLETVSIREFLHGQLGLLGRTLGGNVVLKLLVDDNFPDEDLNLTLDPSQLTSALLNLSLNARDAQKDQGVIGVRLRMREDGLVEIGVHDSGVGMNHEQLSRAIEPFYTTKDNRQGNGLGLSMVYGFSKQMGGDLEIQSQLEVGTSVVMVLPISSANTKLERDHGSTQTVQAGTAHADELSLGVSVEPFELGQAGHQSAPQVQKKSDDDRSQVREAGL